MSPSCAPHDGIKKNHPFPLEPLHVCHGPRASPRPPPADPRPRSRPALLAAADLERRGIGMHGRDRQHRVTSSRVGTSREPRPRVVERAHPVPSRRRRGSRSSVAASADWASLPRPSRSSTNIWSLSVSAEPRRRLRGATSLSSSARRFRIESTSEAAFCMSLPIRGAAGRSRPSSGVAGLSWPPSRPRCEPRYVSASALRAAEEVLADGRCDRQPSSCARTCNRPQRRSSPGTDRDRSGGAPPQRPSRSDPSRGVR